MITLYHSPMTRSTSIISLLQLMGKESEIKIDLVNVQRRGGGGAADARNPHPEKKVPILDVDGHLIRERAAIMLWLTDHFDSPLGRSQASPVRGAYLSWLFYYGNVMEPVLYLTMFDLSEDPVVKEWCRGVSEMIAALETALADRTFLLDENLSAADLLVSSPFKFFPDVVPETGPIKDWLARVEAAQDWTALEAFEVNAMKALGMPLPAPDAA